MTVAVLLVGLSAGFFFTYEASVTLALAEVDDVTYVKSFQAINDTISNPYFAIVFFGSIPAIGAALAVHWRSGRHLVRGLTAAALVLYLAAIAITGTGNVPLNEDLAAVEEITAATAAAARSAFEEDWNRLNLARTLAVVGSFAALAVAATVDRRR